METKRLEDFLIESIFNQVDFCFSFPEIPNSDFLKIFKAKHESDFMKLKTEQDDQEGESDFNKYSSKYESD